MNDFAEILKDDQMKNDYLFNDLFGFRFDELNTINTSQYYEIEIRI
jgi:hypothetical protein